MALETILKQFSHHHQSDWEQLTINMPILNCFSGGLTLVGWLRAFVFAVCASLAVAFCYYEWSTREAMLAKAENDALMLSASLSQHAQDTFEMIDLVLAATADRINVSDRSLADLYAINDGLAGQLRQAWRIRSVMAFDEEGRQFVSSQPQVQDWSDLSRTEAFAYHAKNWGQNLRIGSPVESPTNKDWIIPVTRRFEKPGGGFGGIVMATIRVEYFSNLYEVLDAQSGSIVSLLSRNGTLLSRYPPVEYMIGKNVAGRFWTTDVMEKHKGTLRFPSPVDGVDRVYGFTNVTDFPLVIFFGIDRTAVAKTWLREVMVHLIGAIGVIALLAVMGLQLVKHVGLRQISQLELAKLAQTDSLTGLMNRRAFDHALAKAWLTATPTAPVSLLLLDVDHFKAFNDTYGHPAGDACLQLVAATMTETVYKRPDRVARYGGEEFAVLLPDTEEASALVVAKRICFAIAGLEIPHSASSTEQHLTVSIGVSTYWPNKKGNVTTDNFLKDADRALYKAKLLGRNQVQSSRLSLVPLMLATDEGTQEAKL